MREKDMPKQFHFAILLLIVHDTLVFVAHSQGQAGFISLDCGLPENISYTEVTTTIMYISDATFVNGGENKSISLENREHTQRKELTLRSFPQGIRNCYGIKIRKGNKYLIRATFVYGNYDGLNKTPEFDLHLGVNFWDTVKFKDSSTDVIKEVIHFPVRDYVRVCLANTGHGTPFINVLELRPLLNSTYTAEDAVSLGLVARMDVGSTSNNSYRFPVDAFDRIWYPYASRGWKTLSTSEMVDPQYSIDYQPPPVVMSNAVTPLNASGPLVLELESVDPNTGYYIYMHFAEIQRLKTNETRSFSINVNGRRISRYVTPKYLTSLTSFTNVAFSGELKYSFTLEKLENSSLPPIVNAIEIYARADLSQPETEGVDVDAIMNIKSIYGVTRNWEGDPCLPVKYLWAGLNCSTDGSNPPRITSLNLSASGFISGEIPIAVANLNMLESLDLSNNNLTGSVPNFLSQLPNLRVLNLANNNFTGVVPTELVQKSNNGSLTLSVEENKYLCASSPCKKHNKKKRNVTVPIGASVGTLFALIILAAAILVGVKKKRKQVILGRTKSNPQMDSFRSNKRHFSYFEIVKITENFGRFLGKGGFASVFHGVLDDGTEVAVKRINLPPSAKSSQSHSLDTDNGRNKKAIEEQYQQFHAEVKLLLTVYHGNLTRLVGYCYEEENMVLIYEFMANGDLESHLSGKSGKVLSWETRLQIAVDSAQGLEYLHRGCKPPIIHRDIKAANILLTENFRAKLADFGLSKFFLTDDGTHVSTVNFAGTPGYMDPEMANGGFLNEKTDVYSFGVVLLQLITSKPTRSKVNDQEEWFHLSSWVKLMLDNGNIKAIVDKRLIGDFEVNSVWKAVEIAMECVSMDGVSRPNMTSVVSELRECLALEQARNHNRRASRSIGSRRDVLSLRMTSEISRPLTR